MSVPQLFGIFAASIFAATATAQATDSSNCDFTTAFQHMTTVQATCCTGEDASTTCQTGHPGAENRCSLACGQAYEPFIDECGDTLQAAGMGWDGMDEFYLNCLEVLYPPGACGRSCATADQFRCRSREVHQACCSDNRCATGVRCAPLCDSGYLVLSA